jgi:ABC-type transport system substrate-binding protein
MPPAGRNINYFRDDSITAMLYASDRTADEAKRIELLKAAQRRLSTLVPELPLYNTSKVDAVPVNLTGFTGNPTNAGPFWNVWQWQLTAK